MKNILPSKKRSTSVTFLVVKVTRCNKFPLILTCLIPLKCRKSLNFHQINFPLMSHECLTNKSRVVTTSCSLGLLNAMSSMLWIQVISCGRKKHTNLYESNYDIGRRTVVLWGSTVKFVGFTSSEKTNFFGKPYKISERKNSWQINSCTPSTRVCVNLLRQWSHICPRATMEMVM